MKWAALVAAVLAVGLAWAVDRDLTTGLSLVGTTMTILTGALFPGRGSGDGAAGRAAGRAAGAVAVFVMHRPIGRGRIFAAKAAAAAVLYGVATAVPLLAAYAWLAVPGHVPGPVSPGLLVPRLADDLGGLMWLAAGLLVAARQARWVGSRLVPAGAALLASVLAVTLSMTFAEFVAIDARRGRGVRRGRRGGVRRRRRRAAGGVGRAVAGRRCRWPRGWVVALGVAAGIVAVMIDAFASRPVERAASYYLILDDGRVAVVDPNDRPVGHRATDLQGRAIPGGVPESHVAWANLELSSPRPEDSVRPARVDAWGFHAVASHLRPLRLIGAGGVPNANWFQDVRCNALIGFDRTTRRSLGWLGPDGGSATPRPFPERLVGPDASGSSAGGVLDTLVVTDRSVWQVDLDPDRVRRTFVADAGDAVLSAARFAEGVPGKPRKDRSETRAVATRHAVYLAEGGRPFVRIPQGDPTATYYSVQVRPATDGRIVLDYQPRSAADGTVPPRRGGVRLGRRPARAGDRPAPRCRPAAMACGGSRSPCLWRPSRRPRCRGWSRGDAAEHLRPLVWTTAAAVGVVSALITVPLARRRWYRPAAVAAWAGLSLPAGLARRAVGVVDGRRRGDRAVPGVRPAAAGVAGSTARTAGAAFGAAGGGRHRGVRGGVTGRAVRRRSAGEARSGRRQGRFSNPGFFSRVAEATLPLTACDAGSGQLLAEPVCDLLAGTSVFTSWPTCGSTVNVNRSAAPSAAYAARAAAAAISADGSGLIGSFSPLTASSGRGAISGSTAGQSNSPSMPGITRS